MNTKISEQHINSLIKTITEGFSEGEFNAVLQALKGQSYFADLGNHTQRVFEVMKLANEKNWALQLLDRLIIEKPKNQGLIDIGRFYFPHLRTIENLQKIITSAPWHDPDGLSLKLLISICPRICRVEVMHNFKTTGGTGFLVGPDLVMTNYHVLKLLILGVIPPKNVTFRFDFKGSMINPGVTVKPVDNNPIYAFSPFSTVDLAAAPPLLTQRWGEAELDFVIVQLKERIGDLPLNFLSANNNNTQLIKRGWFSLPNNPLPVRLKSREDLYIFQHPNGNPLTIAHGRAIESGPYNRNTTRFRHDGNTISGSSGAPCFNLNWDLIGLHHSGSPEVESPTYNQSICTNQISTFLKKKQKTLPIYKEPSYTQEIQLVIQIGNEIHSSNAFEEFTDWIRTSLDIREDELSNTREVSLTEKHQILDLVRRRGKLPWILKQAKSKFPNGENLHRLLEEFMQSNPDPFDSAILNASRPFLNRKSLRSYIRTINDRNSSPVLLIDGEAKSGKSFTSHFLFYLRDHASIFNRIEKIDLADFFIDEETVTALEVAKHLNSVLKLNYKWEPPFKIRPFCNALYRELSRAEEKTILLFDGFKTNDGEINTDVHNMLNYLAKLLIQNNVHKITLILIDFEDKLKIDLKQEVNIDQTSRFSKEDLFNFLIKVYENRKRQNPQKNFEPVQVAESYIELKNKIDIENAGIEKIGEAIEKLSLKIMNS